MQLLHKVKENITMYNLIKDGDTVLVGCSGGADSVCLLHILNILRRQMGFIIKAIHVNHMIRENEAEKDEEFVKKVCNLLNVQFFCIREDVMGYARAKKVSVEEAGRSIRYRVFEDLLVYENQGAIAVAHNQNDQAETVLHNLIRGTGIDGLSGIKFKSGNIIRPLLNVDRKEIEEYLSNNNIKAQVDSSNLETHYTRNKIRLDLIPQINKMFDTDITKSILRTTTLLSQDKILIDNIVRMEAEKSIKRENDFAILEIKSLTNKSKAITNRLIREGIKEIAGTVKDIEKKHLDAVLKLIEKNDTGKELCLPHGIRVRTEYNKLKIYKDIKKEKVFVLKNIDIPSITEIENKYIIKTKVYEKDSGKTYSNKQKELCQTFDYDKITKSICFRNRQNGDRIYPINSPGTKKLKDFFIDSKISKEIRDELPLIAQGNDIIWVIGYRSSEVFKVDENTKNILEIICLENILI